MKANKTLIELLQAKNAASNAVDEFFRKNHPFSNFASVQYVRLTQQYLAALDDVIKAQTCLGPTWTFLHGNAVQEKGLEPNR